MATFASLIAPFGGFFASGLKRTFKIKDFGDTIPGHGGITDRMDCQFIMGFFSYMYYHSFIATNQRVTVGLMLQQVIEGLSEQEQIEVVKGLQKYLVGQGVVGEKVCCTFCFYLPPFSPIIYYHYFPPYTLINPDIPPLFLLFSFSFGKSDTSKPFFA